MTQLTNASFDFAVWPLYFAGAIFLLGVWLGRNRWFARPTLDDADPVSTPNPTNTAPITTLPEAPTIRVTDSQRVDRLHRVVSLRRGEHVDLLELTFDRIPRLRITFEAFESASAANVDNGAAPAQDYARVHIELGGAIAGCGSLVKEIGMNQFLVPLATSDEHRCSILHFHGKGDVVNFLRIKLLRLDAARQTIDMDVLHVCGHWTQPA